MSSTRHRVLALYKELHHLGRDYPDPKYPHAAVICAFRNLIASACYTAMISMVAYAGCSRVSNHNNTS